MSKPCTPVVHIKIAGKWMFIPLKMVLIGIDPYPYYHTMFRVSCHWPFCAKRAKRHEEGLGSRVAALLDDGSSAANVSMPDFWTGCWQNILETVYLLINPKTDARHTYETICETRDCRQSFPQQKPQRIVLKVCLVATYWKARRTACVQRESGEVRSSHKCFTKKSLINRVAWKKITDARGWF